MVSKLSKNIPILDLGEQLHTAVNPSHNSSKRQHLQEITAELLGFPQTHPTSCKAPDQNPGAPARTSLCLFPGQGLQAQVTHEGPKVSGCVGCLRHQSAPALAFQVSLWRAVERGGHSVTGHTHDGVRAADRGGVTGHSVRRGGRGEAGHRGEPAVHLS